MSTRLSNGVCKIWFAPCVPQQPGQQRRIAFLSITALRKNLQHHGQRQHPILISAVHLPVCTTKIDIILLTRDHMLLSCVYSHKTTLSYQHDLSVRRSRDCRWISLTRGAVHRGGHDEACSFSDFVYTGHTVVLVTGMTKGLLLWRWPRSWLGITWSVL